MKKRYFILIFTISPDIVFVPRGGSRNKFAKEEREIMAEFYVNHEKGDDLGPGTEKKPFKTIGKAVGAAEALAAGDMSGDICVNVSGNYPVTETIEIKETSSGNNGYKVIYQGAADMTTALSGMIPVDGWVPAADASVSGVYKAKVDAPPDYGTLQFYVGGERRNRARIDAAADEGGFLRASLTPNGETPSFSNTAYYNDAELNGTVAGCVQTPFPADPAAEAAGIKRGIIIPKSALAEGFDLAGIERKSDLEFIFMFQWSQFRVPASDKIVEAGGDGGYFIAGLDDAGGNQFFKNAAYVMLPAFPFCADQWYTIENALEFLTKEGEWYYNKDTQHIYYKPKAGEDMAALGASVPGGPDVFMRVGGKDAANRIKDVVIRNFNFVGENWRYPAKHGMTGSVQSMTYRAIDENSGMETHACPPGVLELTNAEQVSVEFNCFQNNSGSCISATTPEGDSPIYFQNNAICGNVFKNVASGAIMIGEYFGAGEKSLCSGNEISNNYVENAAADFWCASGICAGWGTSNKIANNDLRDLPYTGISCGWGWDNDNEIKIIRNNQITGNFFYNACNTMSDGGAIYFNSVQRGTVISRNYMNSMKRGPYALNNWKCCVAIYFDGGVGGAVAEFNAYENIDLDLAELFFDNTKYSKNPIGSDTANMWAGAETSPSIAEVKAEAGLSEKYRGIVPGYAKP